jgi:hypothetical protein
VNKLSLNWVSCVLRKIVYHQCVRSSLSFAENVDNGHLSKVVDATAQSVDGPASKAGVLRSVVLRAFPFAVVDCLHEGGNDVVLITSSNGHTISFRSWR